MLDQGKDLDWFNSSAIITLFVVSVITFVAWVIWNLTEKHPVVDLTLLKSRSFSLGALIFCLGYAVMFGNLVLIPLWQQGFFGYTATWAGLAAAPSGITAVMVSSLSRP
jgi:DHA2 family multidrug resistance protein